MRRQRGVSLLGALLTLVAWIMLLLALIKVVPLYIDDYFVAGAFADLKRENIGEQDNRTIRRTLENYFNLNNIRDVDPATAKVVREKTRTLVNLGYEKRVNVIGNLDVAVTFTHSYDSSQAR